MYSSGRDVSPAKERIKNSGASTEYVVNVDRAIQRSPSRNGLSSATHERRLSDSGAGILASSKFYLFACVLAFTVVYIFFMIHKFSVDCPALDIPLDQAEYVVHCSRFREKRLAVLVPYLKYDVEKVPRWINTFDTMKPCSEMCGAPTTDLIFYNNRDHLNLTEMVKNITDTFRLSKNGRKCFKEVKFLSAYLNDYEDVREGLIHRGPRNMFFRVFDFLGGQYDYFFQNEPDIDPIRQYWVDALINETMLPKFWMRGTVHKKRGEKLRKSPPEYWDHRMHLNGAALFNLADEEFTKGFMGRVRAIPDDGPFDFAIENYTRDAANWEYMMDHLDKFQYGDFVQNVINDNITREQILERFPATYLVHGLGRSGICPTCKLKAAAWAKEKLEKGQAEKKKKEAQSSTTKPSGGGSPPPASTAKSASQGDNASPSGSKPGSSTPQATAAKPKS
eukprot:TRINITY_DN2338_c0_g1_i1.p1 TRINITY_DN2338_c0_g1~~TRINITY_DN2338_c0_g1_i1.p1  ORF type:complete len:449 (+),score=124.45 TRINITY_DN2338_c0_g1_i1:124-1470(+)